jgi:hypothetical protein
MSRASAFANTQHLNELSFSMRDSSEFIPNSRPPLIQSNKRVPFSIEDITTVWPDHLTQHYGDRFHDPTVLALRQGATPVVDLLQDVQFVSDRKSLRRLVVNRCVTLPPKPFYCKRETFVLLAEKVNGTIFLGGETRFEQAPGSYGQGFEEAMTQQFHRGNTANITTDYCIVKYSLMGQVGCVIRYEADGCNARGEVEELKCKKRPNPRFGLGEEFFLNMWIQMSLSRTQRVHIGLHRDGRVDEVMSLTLEQVQEHANVSSQAAQNCWSKLQSTLTAISNHIPDGCKGRLTCSENGQLSFALTSRNVPLLSPVARAILCPTAEPASVETMAAPAAAPAAAAPAAGQETAAAAASSSAQSRTAVGAAADLSVDDLLSVFDRAVSVANTAT